MVKDDNNNIDSILKQIEQSYSIVSNNGGTGEDIPFSVFETGLTGELGIALQPSSSSTSSHVELELMNHHHQQQHHFSSSTTKKTTRKKRKFSVIE